MRDELVMVVPREALFAGAAAFQGFSRAPGPYLRAALEDYFFMPRRRAEQDTRYKQIIPYVTVRTDPLPGQGPLYLMFQRAGGGDPRLGRLYSIGLGGHVNSGDVLASPVVFGVGRRLGGGGSRLSPASASSAPASATASASAPVSAPAPPPAPGDRQSQVAAGQVQRLLKRRVRFDSGLREAVRPAPAARLHEHPLFRGLRRELREEVKFPPGAVLSLLGAINDDSNPVGEVHFGLAFMLAVPATAAPGPGAARAWAGPVMRRRRPAMQVDLARRRAGIRLRREPGGSVQVGSLFSLDQIEAYSQAMESWSLLLLQAGVLNPGSTAGQVR